MTPDSPGFSDAAKQLIRLLEIMEKLRQPNGCPWDQKQDSHTLAPYLLEETHEVLEAIEHEDTGWLCEELGDLLLQIVFHSQIHSEDNAFTMADVITGIADKMVRRHPHVFDGLEIQCEAELKENWDRIKQDEKLKQGARREPTSPPPHLPALQKAHWRLENKPQTAQTKLSKEPLPQPLSKSLDYLKTLNPEESSHLIPLFIYALVQLCHSQGINSEVELQNYLKSPQSNK